MSNKLFQKISLYTNDAYLFPMDDFLTSEAIAISPDLLITRLETLKAIQNDKPLIVITHLMGYLHFLPNKKIEKLLTGNKNISSSLPLAKRFIQEFLVSQDLEDKAVSKLTQEELEKLKLLKNYEFSPAGNFGFTKAEVTKGGINTDEINHLSFESLKQKNLFFIGECLDITGELGGFNFQIVFSQAYICSLYLNNI